MVLIPCPSLSCFFLNRFVLCVGAVPYKKSFVSSVLPIPGQPNLLLKNKNYHQTYCGCPFYSYLPNNDWFLGKR